MPLVRTNIGTQQSLLIDTSLSNRRLVVKFVPGPAMVITDDKCPHRGGPLHLCYSDKEGRLRCPWHDNLKPKERTLSSSQGFSAIGRRSSGDLTLVSSTTEGLCSVKLIVQ